ncbi:ArsR/SmtB family transcription factor [Haloarchaeobius amylolyticus]|uniref:ArsR/SmtB family transcription factor n=1 Tax=Haloarchaeobius amylolyticus TaxID=1198296 RepID=UPI00226D4906|nr:helix-turn-helix domain-containing protein [Haloarchaeobius amylolyticus]
MGRIFPIKRPVVHEPDQSKLVGLTDETADEVFATLSSATARSILEALYEEPHTPADLREVTGTTLQNVHYHLTNMENAGLIEVVDTWYSEKGSAMNVYAPCARAVLVMASSPSDRSIFRDLLARVLAVALVLGGATLVLARLLDDLARSEPVTEVAGIAATDASQPAGSAASQPLLAPELAFLAGGLLALTLLTVLVVLYVRPFSRPR